MQIQRNSFYIVRVVSDIINIVFAFLIADFFSPPIYSITLNSDGFLLLLGLVLLWTFVAKSLGVYDEFRSRDFTVEVINVIRSLLMLSVLTIVLIFFIKDIYLSRTFVVVFLSASFFLIIAEKYSLRHLIIYMRKKGRNLRNIIIVGAGEVGKNFNDTIKANPHFGYRLLGFLDDAGNCGMNGEYLGKIDDLEKVLESNRIDNVIVALPNYAAERLEHVVKTCENYTTRVKIIPDYFRFISDKYQVEMFGPFPVVSVRNDRLNEFQWRLVKRIFDITFTLFLFTFIFSWLWPIIMLAIKISSPGPIFFKQVRWGRDNKRFDAYKFRSMVAESKDVDENGKFNQATPDDPRITKVGKFIRKTNLDELPQFINVLLGQMSLVGPRPHPTPLNVESKDKFRRYLLRHLAKPGITGWAQVNGFRGETTSDPKKMEERVKHDIWYIENWSFWLDIRIILLTIILMIKGDKNAY